MSDQHVRGRLARAEFTREFLRDFEEQEIRDSFGEQLWQETSPRRWQPTGSDRLTLDVDGVIGDGKEATVYRCTAAPPIGAPFAVAKVYRAQKFRAFSNASQYLRGHRVPDKRSQRALEKRTRRGKEIAHQLWVDREWETLVRLFDAGADVPEPFAHVGDAILMEYLGDEEGPAPLLLRAGLEGSEAEDALDQLLWNIETMLSCDRIHGDLSAYNILWWEGRGVIIDLPQAAEASRSPDGFSLLHRDLTNLCRHFARSGVERDASAIAADLWRRWLRGAL